MDPIADMLIRIKNAQAAGLPSLEIPYSKLKFALAKILLRENFIDGLEEKGKKALRKIQIILKYNQDIPAVQGIKRISKLSRRLYIKRKEIRLKKQERGIIILSTPEGLMTEREAKKAGLGGEIICKVW